jgi:DNA invertase Pin-like site-specific DNA recombinase
VTKSCEQAREEGISIIAIDMSGFNEDAEAITDLCMGLSDADRDNDSRRTANAEAQAQANTTRTLASGLEIEVSVDGESFSASVENLRQLREVLATMLPDAQPGERTVRLVS